MYNYENKAFKNKITAFVLLFVFLVSSLMLASQLPITNNNTTKPTLAGFENYFNSPVDTPVKQYIDDGISSADSPDTMDSYLTDWVSTGVLDRNLKLDTNGNPVITVFAGEPLNVEQINSAMTIESWVDLGGLYLIMGSISSSSNLLKLQHSANRIYIEANPLQDSSKVDINKLTVGEDPNQFVGDAVMKSDQANAAGFNGSGVTVAVVDGGVDFGNSDLEGALALDSNGIPKSFDTEGWSLVSTPLTSSFDINAGADLTLIDNGTYVLATFNDISKLTVQDPWGIGSFSDFSKYFDFTSPRNAWLMPQSWFNLSANQAPLKFGVGMQYWDAAEAGTDSGYIYSVLLDLYAPFGQYDTAVIDMETSAYASYLYYADYWGAKTINPAIGHLFDFTDDKQVSWIDDTTRGSTATGADYTFAKDWNGDGYNDYSYGSMANAYNRYGYLSQNQTLYGKVIHGVDPEGSGFVALHPHAGGFGSHGTWVTSMIAARGNVPYPVFNNNTGSWDSPYGNYTLYKINGTAPASSVMSVAWGASPQDAILAWFWAAGFQLDTTVSSNIVLLSGAQWSWSGTQRAQIASNSWGSYSFASGFRELEWLTDILSTPNMGAEAVYDRDPVDALTFNATSGNFTSVVPWHSFTPFENVTGSSLYLAGQRQFSSVMFNVTVPGTGTPTLSYEYYDGSTWTTFTPVTEADFTASGFQMLNTSNILTSGWKPGNFSVDSTFAYWIRINVTSQFTTAPDVNWVILQIPNQFEGFPGMLVVFSSGNDGNFQSTSANDAGPKAIAVGSFRANTGYSIFGQAFDSYSVAQYSSAGPKSIGTPGVDVLGSAYIFSASPLYTAIDADYAMGEANYSYYFWAGTSASAPSVAGVAALVYQAYQKVMGASAVPDPTFVKTVLKSTAQDVGYPNYLQGAGIVDALSAVNAMTELAGGTSDPNTFLVSANDTYENFYWANTRQRSFFDFYGTGLGDGYGYYGSGAGDAIVDSIDYPYNNYYEGYTNSILLSSPHGDNDLSAFNVMSGDTYNTQLAVVGNQSDVAAQAVHLSQIGAESVVFTNNTTDISESREIFNSTDYRLFLDLTGNFTIPVGADYMEIAVNFDGANTNTNGWRYFELMRTIGTYADFAWGGASTGYVVREYQHLMQLGNPNRFSGQNLALSFRSAINAQSASAWDGLAINVTVTYYQNTPWNAVTITNSTTSNFFDVSIDSTGMPAGFNFGWIYWTDANGNMVHTPLTVKVVYGEITGTASSPTTIGTYTLNEHNDAVYEIHGNLLWIPIAVNESATSSSDVLVFKAEILNSPSSDINLIFTYDDIPKYRGGVTIFQQLGVTGSNMIWYYQPWSELTSYTHTAGGMWTYKLGLYSDWLDMSGVQVKLSAYWISGMPTFTTNFYDSQGNVLSHNDQLLTGPNYMLNATTVCDAPCADPNLVGQYQVVMGDMKIVEFLDQGTYANPQTGSSIDKWIGVDLVAGDYVYLEGGDPNDVSDNDIYIYAPSTAASKGIPASYPVPSTIPSGYDYHTQLDGEAIEWTSFTATQTGKYWVGMDDWGNSNSDYYLYLNIRRGSVAPQGTTSVAVNTQTDSNFGTNVEATYNPTTQTFDKVSPVTVGVYTPTNLGDYLPDSGLVFGTFIIDNVRAPTVTYSPDTLLLDNFELTRTTGETSTVPISWSGVAYNGVSLTYHVWIESPYGTVVYQNDFMSKTFSWDYSDLSTVPDGTYKIMIQADDGLALSGMSNIKTITVNIATSQGVSTVVNTVTTSNLSTTTVHDTVTTTVNVTNTDTSSSSGGSTPGFELFGILAIFFSVGTIVIFRRRK